MSAMNREPRPLCSLPPEELEQMARRHVDGLFGEIRGAGEYLRTECHPLRIIRNHPVVTVAVIGVAGLALARLVRGSRRTPGAAAGATGAAESLGHTVGRSLLAGLAGSAATLLPEAVLALLRRGGHGWRGGPPA
jgi:hypothetical protein